eukprot:Gb_09121 [translate_table: standard]
MEKLTFIVSFTLEGVLKMYCWHMLNVKVAVCQYGRHEFLITPPVDKTPAHFNCLSVAYRLKKSLRDGEVLDSAASADVRVKEPVVRGDAGCMPQHVQSYSQPLETDIKSEDSRRSRMITEDAFHGPQNSQSLRTRPVKGDVICGASKECLEDNLQPERTVSLHRVSEDVRRSAQSTVWPEKRTNEEQAALHKHINPTQAESKFILPGVDQEAVLYSPRREVKQESSNAGRVRPSLARTHPSYLETLGQNHAGWIFGAIAELIDNSRDASASRLDISIELEYYKRAGKRIPVLFMVDNGCGMSHSDIVRMLSFGHKRPEQENKDLIGRFGVGFKTGSMRLGRDVVVLTQSKETRSIAFLSRSFNEDKDDVEIPIITYRKQGGWMDYDLEVHSEAEAEANLKAIKDYSPFNEYAIGNKFACFGEDGTGTQIYVYNLDMWGSDYSLQWDTKSGDSIKKCDIFIRSRRVRSRPGQMSQEVSGS